ncbi:MAG: FGGY family carbohydrate kinase, partial [Pseudomonadota bacterium]
MAPTGLILALDQGTTSSRAILFDDQQRPIATAQQEFPQHLPRSGWVEHDPNDLWATTVATARAALERAGVRAGDVAAIGLTNQRETTVVWDKNTGEATFNAIVWQDRRTAEHCIRLKAGGAEDMVRAKTGLLLDPYFCATKIGWILDHVDGARAKAEAGDLLFGTVDSYLIWRLTDRRVHATDATNAARTALYDIRRGVWDEELCRFFGVPMSMLPHIRDCAADFGESRADLFGAPIAIRGVAGDQQAATIGQACFQPGML